MIVRIATEGQYRLDDQQREVLAELDRGVLTALDSRDEQQFTGAFRKLIEHVREHGEALGHDELVESEVILPPADTSLEEAQAEFHGEGLLPH